MLCRKPRDLDDAGRAVRRRVVRAVMPALRRLDRVSRGQDHFATDHQLRACIALARLAPLLAGAVEPELPDPLDAPEFHTPERELAFRRLEWLHTLTPEQSAQRAIEREAALKAWEESLPGRFDDPKECTEYYRTHKVKQISEVEDELWPPHLRESTLKAKETTDE